MRLAAILLSGAALLTAGPASAARLALLMGNSAYSAPQPSLPHALNDSRDMAAALRKGGFDVTEIQNGAKGVMQSELAAFVAKLKPGDTALFYYAGHGVQAPARSNSAVTDDFLLPVDIKIQSPDSVTQQGLPLTAVLEAFGKAQSGPVLIILDACRNDPAAGASGGTGLAWPSSTASRNAFIIFSASPGETAADPSSGDHGLFTGELLKRINTPGLSAAALFTEVANAVEQQSSPTQRPYFAGSAASAGVVIMPGQKADDAQPLQLAAYRQAVTCDKLDCIEFALPRVAEPRLKEDLEKRIAEFKPLQLPPSPAPAGLEAGTLRAPQTAASPPRPAPARPPAAARGAARSVAPASAPKGSPNPVVSFIAAHHNNAAGEFLIGRNFLFGQEGFPASWAQAKTWFETAAPTYAPAAFQLGVAYEEGLGAKRDLTKAREWYLKAAALGSAEGAAHAGFLFDSPLAGGDVKRSAALYRQAIAGGSTFAMLALAQDYMHGDGGVPETPAEAVRLYTLASANGDADGYLGIGNCHLMGLCGFKTDPAEALRWYHKAADAGSVHALANIGLAYLKGQGTRKDLKAALDWYRKSADRGDTRAARRVGDFYQDGVGGAPKDQVQAASWYRKSAEGGDPFAAEGLARYYDRHRNQPNAVAEAAHWHDEAKALGIKPGMYEMMRWI